jgi:diadenosine tetraphosphatase ApaH/serine/threonine PP2A family protein phosphatase
VGPDVELLHGSPRDPVWEYVLGDEAAAAAFALTTAPLVLIGHSHVALEISNGDDLRGGQAPAGTELELGRLRRLLNPGSVGQPRDGDPRAAWLEIDIAAARATFRRTDYPVERTQDEMREAGLPEALAARLAFGV